jgi:formate hydrogenlyase transcriptional activator
MQRAAPRRFQEEFAVDEFTRHCRELFTDPASTPYNFKDTLSSVLNRLKDNPSDSHFAVCVLDRERGVLEVMIHDPGFHIPAEIPVPGSAMECVLANGEVIQIDDLNDSEQRRQFAVFLASLNLNGSRSVRVMPLSRKNIIFGALVSSSSFPGPYNSRDISVLNYTAEAISLLLENAAMTRLFRLQRSRFETLRDVHCALTSSLEILSKHRIHSGHEIDEHQNFGGVVGKSAALRDVLKQVEIAAPSDATVLLLGETGTGKELMARAVHRLSSRRDSPFIKLNCAAIPTGLLESELFGHEKGAFTGAISQKVGKIELADKGTLFLDEIGEIPMELQPKLLRVLQDHEFERLGGVKTIKVDVRVVSATNRDLAQEVADHQFRSDLFYRLNVFPIHLPPLRERNGDIRLLVEHFAQEFAQRMGKCIESVPPEILQELERWHWPGNIRELENFMERSVILTQGPVLFAPLSELKVFSPDRSRSSGATLEAIERDYVLRILRQTRGIISGPGGAAARLGMKRTTLQSRIQKLGITREEYLS